MTPEAQRPNYDDLAAAIGPAGESRLIVSQNTFSQPLTLYFDDTSMDFDPKLSASEVVLIEARPTKSYAVGTCWWVAICGGVDLAPPPPFEVPAGFALSASGSTWLLDYRVYDSPRPIAIERPVEPTPRVFLQTRP